MYFGYLFASREEALEHSEAVPNGITTKDPGENF
jgi:hypothetical protein